MPVIEENVVRFDISVADPLRMDVHESSKYLVDNNFELEGRDRFFFVFFDEIVKVRIIMCHDNIDVLLVTFKSDVGSINLHHEISTQHVHYFDFSILVFFVLKNPFYGYYLARLLQPSLENLPKSALAN